ncbi:hypothetical protein JOE61_003426 [Nocardioides salarius]|uniref:Uncharacterized protein n=1 Tax=Nocardioides salarius TaxID=374513 RepID=A0ABS2MEQ3_9ACTN|nr:hypothetical protein [Nocardioides salarius]
MVASPSSDGRRRWADPGSCSVPPGGGRLPSSVQRLCEAAARIRCTSCEDPRAGCRHPGVSMTAWPSCGRFFIEPSPVPRQALHRTTVIWQAQDIPHPGTAHRHPRTSAGVVHAGWEESCHDG